MISIPSIKTSSPFLFVAVGLVVLFSALATVAQRSFLSTTSNNTQPPAGERRALLVGISDYERGTSRDDSFANLNTGADIVNMSYVLKTYYLFPAANIRVLQNERATQENIASEFKLQLIDKAKPGDQVVFYYTGHGHFVVDASGDGTADRLRI